MDTQRACRSRAEGNVYRDDPVDAEQLEATESRDIAPAPIPKSGNGLEEHLQHRHAFLDRCKLCKNGTPLQSIPINRDLPIAEHVTITKAYDHLLLQVLPPHWTTHLSLRGLQKTRLYTHELTRLLSILPGSHPLNLLETANHISRITESCHLTDGTQLQICFPKQCFDMIDPHTPNQFERRLVQRLVKPSFKCSPGHWELG